MRSTAFFVGRHRELEILEQKLESALAGSGSVVVLTGEAGVGKTRLALEFLKRSSARGARALRGSCADADWQPPYSPWVDVISDLIRTFGPVWSRPDLAGCHAALRPLIPDLLPASAAPVDLVPLRPEAERLRLYDSVVRLLEAAASESTLVLFLDDLQWADADSLRLLRHVSKFVPRMRALMVCAYRSPEANLDSRHPLSGVLAVLQTETDCELVDLRGLGEREVAEYATRAFGRSVSPGFAEGLAKETGGNPFYLREVTRQMAEDGMLPDRSDGWPSVLALNLGVPEGARRVIDRRMSRLSEDSRRMLLLASGFSGGFDCAVLQELTGLTEDHLLDCLDECLTAGFLVATVELPPAYQFSHAIVRQAIHAGSNPDRRARLHRRIALALERSCAGREMEHAAELASQYHGSLSLTGSEKGVRYALEASEQAKSRRAYEQCVTFLRMASDLCHDCGAGEKAEIIRRLALAEAEALLLDDARRTTEEALETMASAGLSSEEVVAFIADVATTLKEGGALPSLWEPLVERGLSLVSGRQDLLWARLQLLRDRVEPVPGAAAGFSLWLGHDPRAVAILRSRGDEEDYARTLDSPFLPTREETDSILGLSRRWRRPMAVMAAIDANARNLFYCHGAFLEAADRYRELLETAERYGSVSEQAESLAQLAVSQAVLGNLPGARESALSAKHLIDRLGGAHGLHFMELAVDVILAYYLESDWRVLAARADRFVARRSMGRPRHLLARVGLAAESIAAFVECRAGNKLAAERRLSLLARTAGNVPPEYFAQNSMVTIGAAAVWELGAVDLAPAYRKMAIDLITAGVGSGPVGPHQLAVARMAALQGDAGVAEEFFGQARSQAERDGLRPSSAVADFDEAVGLLRNTPSARRRIATLLDSAATEFQALGMVSWEMRARELRERSLSPRSSDSAISVAASGGPSEMRDISPELASLTDREREVLHLLAAGLSNADIAAKLVISVRTAEAHVANILGKLGLSSRTQVVVWAVQRGLGANPRQP